MKKILLFSVLLPALGLSLSLSAGAATVEELRAAMEKQLNCYPLQLVNLEKQEVSITDEELCLATIYAATGMNPLWVSKNGPEKKAADILHFLMNADEEGLRATDYNAEGIKTLWPSRNPDDLAQLDTQLTLNFIKYAHDVSYGRIAPFKTDPGLFAEAGDNHFKPVLLVEQAIAAPDMAQYLSELPPPHEHYRKLRDALQQYRALAETGTWEPIESSGTLHPGDQSEAIRQIRKRLAPAGRNDITAEDELLYDELLIPVVKEFQKKYGLDEDGIIGRKTLAALNMSPEQKRNTIILNMARWRWHEHELGQRYLMVNIANYDLKAVDNGQEILNMAVIVGQFQHQTPVFSDRVKYIVFNPFWNIPSSIARNEELPGLRKDPLHLVKRHVRLLSSWQDDAVELDSTTMDWNTVTPREMNRYRLRQDSGPWNALGRVKFVFPNTYDIYLHDTPARNLFEQTTRTFSHGCIRVSDPLALAEFVLKGKKEEWTMERITDVVGSAKRTVVRLPTPLPVHITYQTAWVDNQGKIYFNNDNYGRDKKLMDILFKQQENNDAASNR